MSMPRTYTHKQNLAIIHLPGTLFHCIMTCCPEPSDPISKQK